MHVKALVGSIEGMKYHPTHTSSTDSGTFNKSESMPLILGAGTGGKRIIINLQ